MGEVIKKVITICLIINIGFITRGWTQYSLNGRVTDSTKIPIPYTTIYLLKEDSIIKYAKSDSNGMYSLRKIEAGSYILSCNYFGVKLQTRSFLLTKDTIIDIAFSISEAQLREKGVTVISRKPIIERKIDRIVFNVENSVYSKGLKIEDVLRETPRLEVADDGSLKMIGKDGVKVMINGRLVSIDRLKSIRSDDISSIEIIPIPPAKYSAEGNSGLINIVLKKKENVGWQGYANIEYTQRVYPSHNQFANINFKSDKFEMSMGIGNFLTNILNKENATFTSSNNQLSSDQRRNNITNMQMLSGAIHYNINDRLHLGGDYDFNFSNVKNKFTGENIYSSLGHGSPDSTINSISSAKNKYSFSTASTYLDYFLDQAKRKKITFTYNYSYNNNPTGWTSSSDLLRNLPLNTRETIVIDNNGRNKYKTNGIFIDLSLPTSFAQIETGTGYTYISNTSQLKQNTIFDSLNLNKTFVDDFLYTEKTPFIYFSASRELSSKWSTKIGLRYEHTNLNGISLSLDSINNTKYGKLFPSFYLLYSPNKVNSISLSYSKRIDRPSFLNLNPFKYYTGIYSFSSGNEFLLPSFSNNIELGYIYKNNLSITIYLTRLLNGIGSIPTYLYGINSLVPQNYINQSRVGAYISYTYRPYAWWNVFGSANVNFNKSESEKPYLQVLDAKGWASSVRLQNSIYLNQQKNSSLSVTYNHYFPSKDGFYKIQSYGNLSARYNYSFNNDKFNIGISANDIFDQQKVIRTLKYSNQLYEGQQLPKVQSISVSLTYNFGNDNVEVSRRKYKIDRNRAQ